MALQSIIPVYPNFSNFERLEDALLEAFGSVRELLQARFIGLPDPPGRLLQEEVELIRQDPVRVLLRSRLLHRPSRGRRLLRRAPRIRGEARYETEADAAPIGPGRYSVSLAALLPRLLPRTATRAWKNTLNWPCFCRN